MREYENVQQQEKGVESSVKIFGSKETKRTKHIKNPKNSGNEQNGSESSEDTHTHRKWYGEKRRTTTTKNARDCYRLLQTHNRANRVKN